MTQTRLPYKLYDDKGRELNSAELMLEQGEIADEFAEALKAFNARHKKFIEQFNEEVEKNAALIFATNLKDSLHAYFFPPTITEQVIQKYYARGQTLFKEAIAAAERAIADNDEAAQLVLKRIAIYIQHKLVEVPWHVPVSRELILLSLLKNSPQAFLSAVNDPSITASIAEINKIKKEYPNELDNDAVFNNQPIPEKIVQYVKHVNNAYAGFQKRHTEIAVQIGQLEAQRQSRWFFQKWWFKVFKDKKLADIQDLQKTQGVLGHLQTNVDNLRRGNDKVHRNYANIAKIVTLQTNIDTLKIKLLDGTISITEIGNLRFSICKLLEQDNKNFKKAATDCLNETKKAIRDNLTILSSKPSVQTALAVQTLKALFNFSELAEVVEFAEIGEETFNFIKNKLDTTENPEEAVLFITNLQSVGDAALPIRIKNKLDATLEKFKDWIQLKAIVAKVIAGTATSKDIEELFQLFASLTEETCSERMKNEAINAIQTVKIVVERCLDGLWKSEAVTTIELGFARTCMVLFEEDKLSVSSLSAEVISAKNSFINNIVNTIENKIQNVAELESYLARLQKIWPEALEPQYIELHNTAKTDVYLAEGHRLSTLPETVLLDCPAQNYKVSIGNVILKAGEKRVFWCTPTLSEKHNRLQQAIELKYRQLIPKINESLGEVSKLREQFSQALLFLKTGEKSLLQRAWGFIVGQSDTALTPENVKKYVTNLIDDYLTKVAEFDADSAEGRYARKKAVQDIEDITKALDSNLEKLLAAPARRKLDAIFDKEGKGKEKETKVDMGQLLMQWQFINAFREKLGSKEADRLYKHAGIGIIYKMDEIAKEEPDFIHEVIGNMTSEQLSALDATFVPDPSFRGESDDYRTVFALDIIGDQQTIGSTGQTVLRKSMLLSQVSALVVQELTAYLNGEESFNMDLFIEHVRFVCEHLPTQQERNHTLNTGNMGLRLREDLKVKLAIAYEEEIKRAFDVTQFSPKLLNDKLDAVQADLQEIRDLLRNERALGEFKKKLQGIDLKNFEESVKVVLADKEKFLTLNRVIGGNSLLELDGNVAHIYDAYKQVKAKEAIDDYEKNMAAEEVSFKKDKKSDAEERHLANQAALNATLKSAAYISYEDLVKLILIREAYKTINVVKVNFNLAEFVKELPQQVIAALPTDMAEIVTDIRYALTDRFAKLFQDQLSERNLDQTPQAREKLKALRGTAFNGLVAMVFPDSPYKDSIFDYLGCTKPHDISARNSSSSISGAKGNASTENSPKVLGTGAPQREPTITLFKQPQKRQGFRHQPASFDRREVANKTTYDISKYLNGERKGREKHKGSLEQYGVFAHKDYEVPIRSQTKPELPAYREHDVGVFGELMDLDEPPILSNPTRMTGKSNA